MSEDIRQYLQECAASYGIAVSSGQAEQFQWYMELLIEWNQKMNLTAITEPKAVVVKHFLDSILLLPELEQGDTLIDVGTGAGFPGVPLKILRPGLHLTLLDSLKERLPRNPPESGAKVTKIKITQNIRAYFYRFFSFTVN